jgi:uncharacterized protein DUF6891
MPVGAVGDGRSWHTAAMTAALLPEDFDDLHEFIRVQVAAGFAPASSIVDESIDVFADTNVPADSLRGAAQALTDQAVAAHLEAQQGWPATTDCDRIDAAFADLAALGIVARQHFTCCGACGATEIHDEIETVEKSGQKVRGYTFYHIQDTEQAVAGEALYLSYGCLSRDKDEAVTIGHEVVEALTRHGLAPGWNGKHAHRIALPVTWQRRR